MAANISCTIRDLSLHKSSIFVTGLIIAKGERSVFTSREKDGKTQAVVRFTIRDTKDHFINCTIWGSQNFVENCVRAYKIGDIIAIDKPRVSQNNISSQYGPKTTSPFALQFTEGKGMIHREAHELFPELSALRNQSIKPSTTSLTLSELVSLPNSNRINIDTVVIVQSMEAIQHIPTKNGVKSKRRILLMDETSHAMQLDIWSPDYLEMSDRWIPMETILHFVDIHFGNNEYEKTRTLSMDGRTIVIENPIRSTRTNLLQHYLQSLTPDERDTFKQIAPKPKQNEVDQITDVMTIRKVLDIIDENGTSEFGAIVYGVITTIDMDPMYGRNPIQKLCKFCQQYLQKKQTHCTNIECIGKLDKGLNYIEHFNISFDLTDHTGTLERCRIRDEYARVLLGCTPEEFKQLPEWQIETIQRKFFMQRFAVKMFIKPKGQKDYTVNALTITTEPNEVVAANIKIY